MVAVAARAHLQGNAVTWTTVEDQCIATKAPFGISNLEYFADVGMLKYPPRQCPFCNRLGSTPYSRRVPLMAFRNFARRGEN